MKSTKTKSQRSIRDRSNTTSRTRAHEIEGDAVAGAVAGAAVGSIAGPVGVVAGGIIGGAVGAMAGAALNDADERRSVRDAQLDREIGVNDGELGAPSLDHPPARVGAYSTASAGAGAGPSSPPSEGPMQDIDD